MENCIFCKIIKGEIPSYTIYEDEFVKAFLDINPSSNGHTLIITKKHITNILDMDEQTINHIFNIIKDKIYKLLKEKLNCDGITIIQNNEYGQDIKHYHVHLIPKYKNKTETIKTEEIYKKIK